tara:strand:+ start:2835 stop:3287 length:453 start_codon:yes stop_codon:yes gene_type:complete
MSNLNMHKRLKNKFFDEFFNSINIIISDDIINIILSYFNLDDNINVLLEDKHTFNYYDDIVTIGKINNFWYTNYNFNNFYQKNYNTKIDNSNFKVKWDIFKTCYNCNYCKPVYHNYDSNDNYEFQHGFILKSNINNKIKYLCNDCYCSLF